MTIDRRSFIQRTALVAAIPTVAALYPLYSMAEAPLLPGPSPQAATATGANSIAFMIDGWDHRDAEVSNENEVFIRINRSWRANWR
jgi:hypothetical protein